MFLLLGVVLVLLVLFVQRQYSYWQRNGFPYDKDSKFPYGSLEAVAKHKKNMAVPIHDAYMKSKEAFVGIYLLFRPALLVRDVDLARNMLAQSFASFHDRGIYVNEKNDPLSATLFTMNGKSWKNMRTKFSPLFSSGKLKAMFLTSDEIGNKMVQHINSLLPEGGTVDLNIEKITTTYAIDIISSVVFGLNTDSFANPQNEFRTFIDFVNRKTIGNTFMNTMLMLCPAVLKVLSYCGITNANLNKAHEMIKRTVEMREKNNVIRKDIIQLMIQLRNNGMIQEDDTNYDWSIKQNNDLYKGITLESISAQAFLFYVAGQATTAGTSAFTIFEMAQHAEVLTKAQQEVREVTEQHNGQITYESLKEMKYLELCIQETLRKYPGLPFLNRECTQDYAIPNSDKVIKRGTPILISLWSIQRDPQYFPNPEAYKPERFLDPNFRQDAYMPFGEGPHSCIAARMGRINAKLAVAKILQNFKLDLLEKQEIEIAHHAIGIQPKGDLTVKLSKYDKTKRDY